MNDLENKSCSHRFSHQDGEAEVEIVSTKREVIPIEDSVNTQPEEGSIILPSKLSFNLLIGWVVHLVVFTIAGTSMYTSMKTEQMMLNEKVSRIEANMYTKQEANLRLEMQKAEYAVLQEEVKKRKGKTNDEAY